MNNLPEILQKVKQLEIIAKKNVDTLLSGRYKSIFKGSGLDFDEIRLYQPGDPIKAIDWKTTARLRKPYIKIFREEHEVNFYFVFDVSGSMNFENKKQIAIEILASLMYSTMKNGDPFGLIAFSNKIELFSKPAKGRKAFLRNLKDLLLLQPENKTSDLSETLIRLKQNIKKKSVIIFISDFLFTINEEKFYPVAKRNEILLFRIYSENEEVKNLEGILPLKDLETEKVSWFFSFNSEKKMSSIFNHIQNSLVNLSNKYRMDYLSIETSENYISKLKHFIYLRKTNSKNIII